VGSYRVVPEASEVVVDARSSVHSIHGSAGEIRGQVEADVVDGVISGALGGRLEVPIDGLRSGNRFLDAELRRRTDARRHPVIVGEIRHAATTSDGGHFRVDGEVTFHGQTQPVTGELLVRAEGDRLILEGEHVFDIRDFGLAPPRVLMLSVEPDVTVRIRLVVEPA
jgi:polyisoprenoid-binding protein YceI